MQPSHRVLAVDDNPTNLAIIEESLKGHFSLRAVDNGKEALRLATDFQPDVVLLDVMMPSPDGFEVCSRLKNNRDLGHTQIIMVSAKTELDSRLRGYQAGADDYVMKPFSSEELYAKVCVNLRAKTIYSVIHNQLDKLCGATGEALQLVSQLRDAETASHLVRMRDYSQFIAVELCNTSYAHQIDDRFLDDLYLASPLHDIGKVAIPDSILLKPGPLTPEEFQAMQQHTLIGHRILSRLSDREPRVPMFTMAADIAKYHHECVDGSGYPQGLVGDAIPLAARIVKVGDVFDAITSVRPYKQKQSPEEARRWIVERRGSAFDPVVVDAFLQAYDDIAEIALHGDSLQFV